MERALHGWSVRADVRPHRHRRRAGCRRRLLATVVDSVDTSGLLAPVVQTTVCGGGGAVLVDRADGADLVVVGSRGLGGFKGLLLGSVGHQVSHHAPCPVIVIPHLR